MIIRNHLIFNYCRLLFHYVYLFFVEDVASNYGCPHWLHGPRILLVVNLVGEIVAILIPQLQAFVPCITLDALRAHMYQRLVVYDATVPIVVVCLPVEYGIGTVPMAVRLVGLHLDIELLDIVIIVHILIINCSLTPSCSANLLTLVPIFVVCLNDILHILTSLIGVQAVKAPAVELPAV